MMQHTKSRVNRGVQARVMWFSATYQPGDSPQHWPDDQPYNLRRDVEICSLTAFGDTLYQGQREIQQLISVYSAQGLTAANCAKGWILGWHRHSSTRTSKSWWEEFHRPRRLKLLEEIKGKSLDELDELMLQFERDFKDRDSNPVPSQTIAIEVETQEHEYSEAASPSPDANSSSEWEP